MLSIPSKRQALLVCYVNPEDSKERQAYVKRHNKAITDPKSGFEAFFVSQFDALLMYVQAYQKALNCDVREDNIIGDQFSNMGEALIGLLDCEHGRIDAATYAHSVRILTTLA